jgi:hypothetical protein
VKTTTNAAMAQIALPGPRFDAVAGGVTTNDSLVTAVVGDDVSDSANATSFAVWKRFSRSFSRQWRTMWSSAGETLRPDCVSSGGSSRMIAAIVSLAVSRLNAFLPERSS